MAFDSFFNPVSHAVVGTAWDNKLSSSSYLSYLSKGGIDSSDLAVTYSSQRTEWAYSSSCCDSIHSTSNRGRGGRQFARPAPPVDHSSVSDRQFISLVRDSNPGDTLERDRSLTLKAEPPRAIPCSWINPLTISQFAFSSKEGTTGTFQIQLNQAPTTAVTLTFAGGDFLVVDADGNPRNGTQSSLTLTPENWQQSRTVWFIVENDNVSIDRIAGNTIAYSLSGGLSFDGIYDLGTITNTYAPDPTRFNIDLDFRNDFLGFWTPERQAIAQKAAKDWADLIANEWAGFQLNQPIEVLDNGFSSGSRFTSKRYVDDVLVFVNSINSGGLVGGYGGPEYQFGGWVQPDGTGSMPRVGQIAIDAAVTELYLYNAVLHELGHVLGLVGLNWAGYLQQDLSTPQTASFNGYYSTLANGGNPIPLQSQDGANSVTGQYNYYHPSDRVISAMSYGWLYTVTGPTGIDAAMLADSGYQVVGVNA